MHSSTYFAIIIVILISFLHDFPSAYGRLFQICNSTNGNYAANDPYAADLDKLTGCLTTQAAFWGSGIASVGQAYGIVLCRGDVASTADCKNCVVEAGAEIRNWCPSEKGAIIWYDHCLLKYTNQNFFGQVDYRNFSLWNYKVVDDPASFNAKTKELLSQLANEAAATPKRYASGEIEYVYGSQSQTLYGMTQCTRDLSAADCKKCVDDIIADFNTCCDGKEGGRLIAASCNFRYEIFPFLRT